MITVRLESLLKKVIDNRGKTPPLVENGYELIETASLVGISKFPDYRRVSKHVSENTYNKWFRKGHPAKNDILIATVGANIGSVAIMRENRGCVAQNLVGLRTDVNKIDPHFLYYFLSWDFTQKRLKNLDIGAAQPSIKVPHLLNLQIDLPELYQQMQITSILSAYDDLIENNTRRILILEDMAQRIYTEWFVHFRFPGHEKVKMVDSELGRIPSGWELGQLKDVASVNEKNIKKGNTPDSIHYIDIKSVSTGRVNQIRDLDFSDAPSRSRRLVRSQDIIWATVRPNLKAYALIIEPEPNTVASTGFAVITSKGLPYTYLYCHLATDAFAEYLANHASGSAYPAVNQNDFKNATVIIPDEISVKSFHDFTDPFWFHIHVLAKKNKYLRQTRDLLLPKLISGDIDVSEMPDPEEAAAA